MDIRIDRLRLRAAGISEESAQQLARLIAERLSSALAPAAGPGHLGRLDVTLEARTGDSLDDLADSAVAGVLRAAARTSA